MKPTPEQLVTGLAQVRAQIAQLEALDKDYVQQLVACGAGDYTDGERTAKVIVPAAGAPKYDLKAADTDAVRELCGDNFGKLFLRSVTFAPIKEFGAVAGALLQRGALKKVLALTEKPARAASPYVKLS